MLRQSDVELLALATFAGAAAGGLVARFRHRVGVLTIAVALGLAWLGDRALVHAVPRAALADAGPWLAPLAVAVAVGWGARRLPVAGTTMGRAPVLPLALLSLVGVWAGVPETSAALLTAGVVAGIAVVLVASRSELSVAGGVAIAAAPVAAAYFGAVGDAHALLGGLLCSATFVVLGFGPRLVAVSSSALARGSAAHLASALAAARLIGVRRDWTAAPLWVAIVLGLAVLSAWLLRSDQPGQPS